MLDETLLDAPDALGRADVRGLLRDTAEAGARVRTAVRQAREVGLAELRPDGRPRAVLVAGASPAAECVADLLGALGRGSLPVSLLRPTGARYGADALRWTLPGWAGPLDLLLVATPDGTENGLYGLVEQAYRRGCSVVTVCPDAAPLEEVTRGTNGLAVPLDRPSAPTHEPGQEPGQEQELVHEEAQSTAARRTAETVTPSGFWALFTPLVVLYGRLGLFDAEEADAVHSLADRLDRVAERCGPVVETYENPAKTLAAELSGGLPLLWSEGPLAHTAARHCATAHTALAGLPALAAELPEALALHGALLDGPYAAGASEEDFFRDRVEDPEPRHARVVLLSEEPAPSDGSAPPADEASSDRPSPSSSSSPSPSPSPDSALPAARELAYAHGVPIGELRPARPGSPLETAAELLATADFAVVYLALAGSGP